MTARKPLQRAKPGKALARLQANSKKKRDDTGLRLVLFQLLAVTGHWAQALSQVQTAGAIEDAFAPRAQFLKSVVEVEQVCASVFEGKPLPSIFGPTTGSLKLQSKVSSIEKPNRSAAAVKTQRKALKPTPTRAGFVDVQTSKWTCDIDARLGPAIESYLRSKYHLVPTERIIQIDLEPRDLQDLVQLPAEIKCLNGETDSVHVPVRYATEPSANSDRLLTRTIDWRRHRPNYLIGTGVRVLAADCSDFPITKVRTPKFSTRYGSQS